MGDRPEALTTVARPSAAENTVANPSPPTPDMCGSTTPIVLAAARYASMAFPPRRKIAMAASVASGWLVTTAPRRPMATGRHVRSDAHVSVIELLRSPVILLPEDAFEDLPDSIQMLLLHDERRRERQDVSRHPG